MFSETQRLAGLSADLVQTRNQIAQALKQNRVEEAERGAIAALATLSDHPEFLRLMALVKLAQNQTEEGIGLLLQARALQPDDPSIHDALGTAYEQIRDYSRARVALYSACRLDPENPGFWFNYANRIYASGDNEGALAAAQRVVQLSPEHSGARGLLAILKMAAGNHAEAQNEFRSIIRDNPAAAGIAWWWLATLKPMPLTDADVTLMQSILVDRAVSPKRRAPIGFALALALESRGRIEEAFQVLQNAHAQARQSAPPYDVSEPSRHISDVLQAFDPIPAGAGGAQGKEVIFIASMPRSGSTLTEQILASHSQVEGGGELQDFMQVVIDETDRTEQSFPGWVRTHSPAQWRTLGQRYLARTRQFRKRRPRFTDKRLENWVMAGVIVSSLPEARVIIVRRDPLENCLACYRYMITHDYTHTFSDLATVWHDFDRATRRWQELYPDRVYVQEYEELVADPETQIRKLLEFCDLPFEEACLNSHMTERMVNTPSATQVREPIRRDTARAQKYGALLDPLRSELGLPPFEA